MHNKCSYMLPVPKHSAFHIHHKKMNKAAMHICIQVHNSFEYFFEALNDFPSVNLTSVICT